MHVAQQGQLARGLDLVSGRGGQFFQGADGGGGGVSPGTDRDAAAWLPLSVLSARRLRAAAMPAGLEPAVTDLALRALVSPRPES